MEQSTSQQCHYRPTAAPCYCSFHTVRRKERKNRALSTRKVPKHMHLLLPTAVPEVTIKLQCKKFHLP